MATEYASPARTARATSSFFEQTFNWNSLGQITDVVTHGVPTRFDDSGVDRTHSVRLRGDNARVNRYVYTPWGERQAATSQLPGTAETVYNPLQFAGREYDAATGLVHLRARFYDPALGRCPCEDPIGLGGGINPSAYAGNDPVNARDPYGLCEATLTGSMSDGLVFTPCGSDDPAAETVDDNNGNGGAESDPGSALPAGSGPVGEGCPTCKKAARAVQQWNRCVASTANENFQETNEILFTTAARHARSLGMLAAGGMAAKLTNSSSILDDAASYLRRGRYLYNRTWLSDVNGRLRFGAAGFRSAVFNTAVRSAGLNVALETGLGLSSVAVALDTCNGE